MSKGIKTSLGDGREIHIIALTTDDGRWLGNVVMEYNDAERWGRYYSITDYGDYAHNWSAVPPEGFEEFLMTADPDYLIKKLASNHDEASVLDVDAATAKLTEMILARAEKEDADCLGDALCMLARCETESDIWQWQAQHRDLVDSDDIGEAIVYRPGRWLEGYKKHVISALQAYLRDSRYAAAC